MKEINLDKLIKSLEELKEKGHTTVEIEGTLMCKQDGNSIIRTTEEQM